MTLPESRDLLRTRLRAERDALSPAHQAAAAERFCEFCLPLLGQARHIAGYFAFGGEISVDKLLEKCRENGAVTYAPQVRGEALRFLPFDARTPMRTARFGIRIPDLRGPQADSQARDPLAVDAVLVPLVGFDAGCNRLGMGGGFYDRSFAARREQGSASVATPLLIGCAHSLQQVESVLPDWWDVPVDMVVTDTGVIQRPV